MAAMVGLNNVAKQPPLKIGDKSFDPVSWWQEKGIIYSYNPNKGGETQQHDLRKAILRIRYLQNVINKVTPGNKGMHRESQDDFNRFVDEFYHKVFKPATKYPNPFQQVENSLKEASQEAEANHQRRQQIIVPESYGKKA
jgi:hypothetical protein